jgi:trehalose synthase
MERLDGMLRGVTMPGSALGSGEEDAYRKGRQDGDTLIPTDVQAGDIVVLHDPVAAALATAIRERGAHAIWRTSIGRWESNTATAWRFLHRSAPALDAYIATWRPDRAGWLGGRALAAYISAPAVVSAKAVDADRPGQRADEICWTTLLADVVRNDRAERVGGTVQARPSVAAR